MRYLWRILDLLVGGLFIYAGVLKVLDPCAGSRWLSAGSISVA